MWLDHICSCNGIKRLRLAFCYYLGDTGLAEVAAKLPLLEDLELSFNDRFSDEKTIEAIGLHCPRLKLLKYNCSGSYFGSPPTGDDEITQVISKTMPGLRHLQLVGNILTNVGLDAILSVCPYLEDLDLRLCPLVDLAGELGKRCAEQIKNLRLPSEPTDCFDDCEDDSDVSGGDSDDYGSDSYDGSDSCSSLGSEDLDYD